MTTVAQSRLFVIGVDTHARTHALAVVSASTGEQLACEQFPATATGMKLAIDWARCPRESADCGFGATGPTMS